MKSPALLRLEEKLRQELPRMSPDSQLAQDVARLGFERGIEYAARQCWREIMAVEAAKDAVKRGRR